jgi:hypothetical protein
LSGKCRNDGVLGDVAAGSDGGAASAGEVVAIGASNAFDDTKVAQAGDLSREGGRGALSDQRSKVGTAKTSDVEARTVQGREQGLFGATEKVEAFDVAAVPNTVDFCP